MKFIGDFNYTLTYCLGCKLVQVDALLHLYTTHLLSVTNIDSYQPMWYAYIKNDNYLNNIPETTLEKLIDNKDKFKVV